MTDAYQSHRKTLRTLNLLEVELISAGRIAPQFLGNAGK